MAPYFSGRRALPALLLSGGWVVVVLACGDSAKTYAPPPPPAPVASVTVTPGSDTLVALNDVHQFHAVARDSAGTTLTGRTVTWNSSDTTVATVSFDGWARAKRDGTAQITAEIEGVRATAGLRVAQRVASIVIAPDSFRLVALAVAEQFTAIASDINHNPVPGIQFQWTSSDSQVVTIDSTGRATSRDTGLVTIRATIQGVTDSAVLRIVQMPFRFKFTTLPIGVVAGAPFSPEVVAEVQDSTGHRVKGSHDPVLIWLVFDPANAPLQGVTTVNAIDGVAHFPGLSIDRALSGYALGLDSPVRPMVWDISPYFDVAPAAATHLAFTWLPSGAPFASGLPFYVDVQIQDPFGNVVTGSTNPVTLSLLTNPTGDTIAGTTVVDAVNGIATFSVSLSLTGSGYLFGATTPGLAPAQSLPFDISAPPPGGLPPRRALPR